MLGFNRSVYKSTRDKKLVPNLLAQDGVFYILGTRDFPCIMRISYRTKSSVKVHYRILGEVI